MGRTNNLWILDIYYDKKIIKSFFNNFYINPYIQFLYEQIDMDKMWLFNDESTDNGGILEWSIKNFELSIDKKLFMEHEFIDLNEFIKSKSIDDYAFGHPSSEMNHKFVEKIIKKSL